MLKNKSTFRRMLISVVAILLLQSLLIGSVLFANGTINSLKDSSIDMLRKNMENRSITLENMMVHGWSNIEVLEQEAVLTIETLSEEKGITPGELLSDKQNTHEVLLGISKTALGTLRMSSSTGVFVYFVDYENILESDSQRGFYFRDLDPVSNPGDFSDIQCVKGPVSIARENDIPLDSLWTETFSFFKDNEIIWDNYSRLAENARSNPGLHSENLSYWSKPHLLDPNNRLDSNKYITYTRPIIVQGDVVGVVGSEVQNSHIQQYFPYSDFGASGQGGYMLITYDSDEFSGDTLKCEIQQLTGSYLKRALGSAKELELQRGKKGVYQIAESGYEDILITIRPLKLYNTNAPYSSEQWALAAMGTRDMLYESARNVTAGVLVSTALAFILGTIILVFAIRRLTNPLTQIAQQIEQNDTYEHIVLDKSSTYEISLLCTTINEMKNRRKKMDEELKEEQERYLMALESATDTFIEYDTVADSFMLFYFESRDGNSPLRSLRFDNFGKDLDSLKFCPAEDVDKIRAFISGDRKKTGAVRIREEILEKIITSESDRGYYWIIIRPKHIYDENGMLKKIIGNAREVTEEKRRENKRLEDAKRDVTTGIYNNSYGMDRMKRELPLLRGGKTRYSIIYFRIENVNLFEAYYGRAFTGVCLRNFINRVSYLFPRRDLAARLWNDELLALVPGAGGRDALEIAGTVLNLMDTVYMGENKELKLKVRAGIAQGGGSDNLSQLVLQAGKALLYSIDTGKPQIYDELPDEWKRAEFSPSYRPVNLFLGISRETIVSVIFEIFERTKDIESTIRLALELLGGVFALDHIVIYRYEIDFDTNQISHQWHKMQELVLPAMVEMCPREDYMAMKKLFGDKDILVYDKWELDSERPGIARLLGAPLAEGSSSLCSLIFENGIESGRIIFTQDSKREWKEEDIFSLSEAAKIISAHISILRSSSASRAKSEFLSRVSHEIRTPMNAIIGMTGIAREQIDDKDRVSDSLGKIDYSARHLLQLINDVLDMSKIESGKLQIQEAVFSFNELIDGLDTLMRPQIEAKDISFVIKRSFRREYVVGDEYRLRQVIVNFLGNAYKFTDKGGEITLSVIELESEKPDSSVYRIGVRDNGVGISREDQKKVFNAFEQAATSTKQKIGTGLGLAISSSIISAMNSTIRLESELGEGSEFSFVIELSHGEPLENEAVSTEQERTVSFKGKKALLVEDNDINMEIALYVLQDMGLEVECAENGKIAVDRFLESELYEYDIILMDIQMPIMDGLEATREIRRNTDRTDAREIPIVAMTANAFEGDMKLSIDTGMNGHISKPIDNDLLLKLLEELLLGNSD